MDFSGSVPTQILVFIYGFICICLSLVAAKMQSILQASIIVFGVIGGPMLGLFTLGMFSHVGNEKVIKNYYQNFKILIHYFRIFNFINNI